VLPVSNDYDEGVYAGVAIRLVHGTLPYRDFVFVHPPGIALLLSPVALLGELVGTSASTLIVARVLSVVVVAINVILVGRLVRPIGRVAVVMASFSLAVWPLAVSVDPILELEPSLVLFCLLGALLVFKADGEVSMRRIFLGGLAFGFAFAVKVWAFMPIVAVVLVMLPRWRRELRPLVLGMATAIVVTCLPFFLAAPHAFVHDVLVDQLSQKPAINNFGTPFGQVLLMISGLSGLTAVAVPTWVAGLVFLLLAVAVAVVYGVWWRTRTRLEWYIFASAVITFVAMFDATYFTDHYGYFPAAMFAPLLGVCAGRIWGYARRSRASHIVFRRVPARVVGVVSLVVVLGVVVFMVEQDTSHARSYAAGASSVLGLDAYLPKGACVLSDFSTSLVLADRINSSQTNCPAEIDPYGMYLADDDGAIPHVGGPFEIAFEVQWLSDLEQADYVELRIPLSDFVPWTPPLINWFQQSYVQVATVPDDYGYPIYLYRRVGS
jgi:hypothetical protein